MRGVAVCATRSLAFQIELFEDTEMIKYIIRRLLYMIPVLLGVAFLVFTILSLTPGTPGEIILGITAKPEEFLEVLQGVQSAVGMEVTAQCYKRPKSAPTPELQPFFDWKTDIGLIVHEDVGEGIFGPELGQRAGEFLEKLIPLYDYFNLITLG